MELWQRVAGGLENTGCWGMTTKARDPDRMIRSQSPLEHRDLMLGSMGARPTPFKRLGPRICGWQGTRTGLKDRDDNSNIFASCQIRSNPNL